MQGNQQHPPSYQPGLKPRQRKTGTRRLASAAWEPLTPGGVARYSLASLNRVCGLQIVTALISMLVILWFLNTALFPVIREAITQLPEAGRIAFGELDSPEPAILPLAENNHLSIHLDLENNHRPPTSHDLDVKLTRKGLYACTSFGCSFLPYAPTWRFPMDRTETLAWWDAWSAMLLAMAGFGTVVGLMVVWWSLATIYCLLPRTLAWMGSRQLTLGGAWRLSAAALIPGAVTMLVGLVCYGLGMFDWVHFLLIAGIHLGVPWLYLVAAPFQLPRREGKVQTEPSSEGVGTASPFGGHGSAAPNPFQGESASVDPEVVPEDVGEVSDPVPQADPEPAGARALEADPPSVPLPKTRENPFAAPKAVDGTGSERAAEARPKSRKSNPFQAE